MCEKSGDSEVIRGQIVPSSGTNKRRQNNKLSNKIETLERWMDKKLKNFSSNNCLSGLKLSNKKLKVNSSGGPSFKHVKNCFFKSHKSSEIYEKEFDSIELKSFLDLKEKVLSEKKHFQLDDLKSHDECLVCLTSAIDLDVNNELKSNRAKCGLDTIGKNPNHFDKETKNNLTFAILFGDEDQLKNDCSELTQYLDIDELSVSIEFSVSDMDTESGVEDYYAYESSQSEFESDSSSRTMHYSELEVIGKDCKYFDSEELSVSIEFSSNSEYSLNSAECIVSF